MKRERIPDPIQGQQKTCQDLLTLRRSFSLHRVDSNSATKQIKPFPLFFRDNNPFIWSHFIAKNCPGLARLSPSYTFPLVLSHSILADCGNLVRCFGWMGQPHRERV